MGKKQAARLDRNGQGHNFAECIISSFITSGSGSNKGNNSFSFSANDSIKV